MLGQDVHQDWLWWSILCRPADDPWLRRMSYLAPAGHSELKPPEPWEGKWSTMRRPTIEQSGLGTCDQHTNTQVLNTFYTITQDAIAYNSVYGDEYNSSDCILDTQYMKRQPSAMSLTEVRNSIGRRSVNVCLPHADGHRPQSPWSAYACPLLKSKQHSHIPRLIAFIPMPEEKSSTGWLLNCSTSRHFDWTTRISTLAIHR